MRVSKIIAAGVWLSLLIAAAALPAEAQDRDGDASSQLPEQPKPAAKPNQFPALNPYAYSAPEAPPFVAPKIDIEPEPSPVALRLWPFDEQERAEGRRAGSEIHVYTNEVIAPVTVLDKRGQFVLDLEQKDFRVFDNGVEQKIDHWDVGGDSLAVTLVLETSSHLEMMAPVIRSLGSIFGETVMALNGEAAVLTYDATVDLRQNFTRDHDAVERAVADVQFEAPELHLYDAMAAAVDLLKTQPENLRRVMVIVGESQDTGSAAKLGLVLREAELANIAIYAVGPSSSSADLRFGELEPLMLPGTSVPMTTHGPGQNRIGRNFYNWMGPAMWVVTRGTNEIKNHQLEVAAAATGGVHYRALREATMRDALDRIGGELHSQYIVIYTPAGEVEGFHEIRIEVTRPDSVVRTRPGYFRTRPEDEVDVTGRKKGPAAPVQHFFAVQ